jgi:hypothetical protein
MTGAARSSGSSSERSETFLGTIEHWLGWLDGSSRDSLWWSESPDAVRVISHGDSR